MKRCYLYSMMVVLGAVLFYGCSTVPEEAGPVGRPSNSVRAQHILLMTRNMSEAAKAEKRVEAEDIRAQLEAGADFSKMAVKYSDCPSKSQGGDLGVFGRGQMVKPFEDAAFSQKKNAIGPVIETRFGYHIIKVTEQY